MTKNVRVKVSPASELESLSARIKEPTPSAELKPNGNESCPLIPVISCVPTFANTTVNGTFLSPGSTSIFSSGMPKNESRYFTSPNFRSNGEPLVLT